MNLLPFATAPTYSTSSLYWICNIPIRMEAMVRSRRKCWSCMMLILIQLSIIRWCLIGILIRWRIWLVEFSIIIFCLVSWLLLPLGKTVMCWEERLVWTLSGPGSGPGLLQFRIKYPKTTLKLDNMSWSAEGSWRLIKSISCLRWWPRRSKPKT